MGKFASYPTVKTIGIWSAMLQIAANAHRDVFGVQTFASVRDLSVRKTSSRDNFISLLCQIDETHEQYDHFLLS
jgi:hypothetical protein